MMKTLICTLLITAIGVIGACERSPADPLQKLVEETDLAIVDLSVPFERFAEAPGRLQRIADAIASGAPGLYVLRYYDDTLRQTQHVFAIYEDGKTYIELTSLPNEQPTRAESAISSAEYDEATKTLTLHTHSGDIRLTPADITPAGA